MTLFVRSAYNYDTGKASLESGLECNDPSLAKQSFADEVDINTIVRRFNLTGELPQDVRAPEYADFTDVVDYHTALNAIAMAHEAFDSMPAQVRARFQNDPGSFVDFCNDPANIDEMVKMGLAVKKSINTANLSASDVAIGSENQSDAVAQATEADSKGA